MPSLAPIKAALPMRYKQLVRRTLLRMAAVTNAGSDVTCPCCGRSFRKFARFYGANEQCPGCGSLVRHRALHLYLRDVAGLPSAGSDVLHVAPNAALLSWLSSRDEIRIVTLDLDSPLADIHADITTLPLPADSFDLIICLHVLEHVPDDRQAIRELFRVLRQSGTAIVQVPPDPVDETFEDFTVTSPASRERLFGQYDHVRMCGPDYRLRIEAAGFDVEPVDHVEHLDEATRTRHGLRVGEPFYVCTKPTATE